jgi:hypothetical protein
MTLALAIAVTIHRIKNVRYKKSIVAQVDSKIDKRYDISGSPIQCESGDNELLNSGKKFRFHTLIYEMNFDCSRCLIDIKKIYDFYSRLSQIQEIKFYLITKIKSLGYVKFHLDKSLQKYKLWVVQQNFIKDNIKLYLVDQNNKILMAGDITRYPFLREEYLKRFKKSIH